MATAVEAWRTLSAVHQSAAVAAALAGYGAPCHESVSLPFGYHQYATGYEENLSGLVFFHILKLNACTEVSMFL